MKSALKLFIIGCLVLIFCQCSMNKDSYLKDFEKFDTESPFRETRSTVPPCPILNGKKYRPGSTIIQKNITNSLKRN